MRYYRRFIVINVLNKGFEKVLVTESDDCIKE